nr:HU family DNA-binding protein [Phormidesmis priestleyi]
MNKGELVDAIAEKAEVSKKDADTVLTAIIESIVEAVSSGDKVSLIGFGSFEPRDQTGERGTQPQDGGQDDNRGDSDSCLFCGESL